MSKTLFQKIIDNEIPSLKVYENDKYIAILDIAPKQKGHTLLIPKQREESIMTDTTIVKETILGIAHIISNTLIESLGATGVKFVFNSGKSAGQVVMHTHLHIIPYYDSKKEVINNQQVLDEILKNNS